MNNLLDQVIEIAHQAGAAIMEIYKSQDLGVSHKEDDSPLTKADQAAHEIIDSALKQISKHPIICEEGSHTAGGAHTFWLVDPLDGTKEFIKRRGEFTVNIALIKDKRPVLGVVYAPVLDVTYAAAEDSGAFKLENGKRQPIKALFTDKIPKVITSKSHRTPETDEFLATIGQHEEISIGSSLKLCLVAEGKALLYPRMGPTHLWDTAAGDAVVRAAGGTVADKQGQALAYDPKKTLLNPNFVARAKRKV